MQAACAELGFLGADLGPESVGTRASSAGSSQAVVCQRAL